MDPGMGLLDHIIALFLDFLGFSLLFSIVPTLIYTPTNSVQVYMMNYNSAIKMKEILPFIEKWMNIGNTMLSEINQRQILY